MILRETKIFGQVAVGILMLIAFCTDLSSGYYAGKWIPVCAACALLGALKLYESYGAALATNFFYLLMSGVWIFSFNNRYVSGQACDIITAPINSNLSAQELCNVHIQTIKLFSLESSFKLAIFAFPLLWFAGQRLLRELDLRDIGRIFAVLFFVISSGMVAWEFLMSKDHCSGTSPCGGALTASSQNSSTLALLLPLMPFPLLFGIISALCAFAAKSAIGAGMTALFLGAWAIKKAKKWALIPALLILPLAHFTHGGKLLFDSSGRFQVWKFFMNIWLSTSNAWAFGAGFGSFGAFSFKLQHLLHFGQFGKELNWWITMDNEWLEQVFTSGLVGAALLIWLFCSIAWGLWKKGYHKEFASLLLFGLGSGGNPLLHIAPTCAFATWLTCLGLFKKEPIKDCFDGVDPHYGGAPTAKR